MSKIDPKEFKLMRDYIEKQCGIDISDNKMYLVETRLTTLMIENHCENFNQFYQKAVSDTTNKLKDKIVDAMTTNETLWFRDMSPFTVLEEVILKKYAEEVQSGKRSKIKIWCAACSTGQEPYSIAMAIKEFSLRSPSLKPEHFEIIGTDISPTVLFIAMAARYDKLAITRGLPEELKTKYFTAAGTVWALNPDIKKMVTFKRLNLQESFSGIGKPDIVFCRNVLIYFAEDFKKDILKRIHTVLPSSGYLFVGGAESLFSYTTDFEPLRHGKASYYRAK